MPAGGMLIGAAVGVGATIYGAIQKKKAQKAQEALLASRPQYSINPEEYDIENMAESRANQGMGAGARQQLQNNTDRSLATQSNAILMGGGDANSISNLADKSQQAYGATAMYDDQERLKNLNNLQQSWARMSANKDKAWDINSNQQWKDKMAANTQNLQSANNMEMSGIGSLTGALGGLGKSMGGGGNNGGGGGSMGGGGYGSGGGGAFSNYSPVSGGDPMADAGMM